MKTYRVTLILANYHTKSVWVQATDKLAAGAIAKKEQGNRCRVWAVHDFTD